MEMDLHWFDIANITTTFTQQYISAKMNDKNDNIVDVNRARNEIYYKWNGKIIFVDNI